MLGAVEWGIYLYLSMGTIMSMMLLFTRSSRIRSANVGSHAIVFKSLRFGPFTLKRNPGVFKLKRGLQHVIYLLDLGFVLKFQFSFVPWHISISQRNVQHFVQAIVKEHLLIYNVLNVILLKKKGENSIVKSVSWVEWIVTSLSLTVKLKM